MAFKKGQSGNPGGRPKENKEVQALAREYTVEAIDRLAFWMRSDNAKASVAASSALLDRGFGKPTMHVEAEVSHRNVVRVPNKAKSPETWQQQHAPATTIQ